MSYSDLVHSMEGERKPGTGYNLTIAALVFLSGIISAMILCQGCNTGIQALNGAAKDAILLGGYVVKSTENRGPAMTDLLPPSNAGSMASDHVISVDEARDIARSYGLVIE